MVVCFASMILTMMIIIVCIVKTTNVPENLNNDTILAKQKRSVQRILSYDVNKKSQKRRLQTNSTLMDSEKLTVFDTHIKTNNAVLHKRLLEGHAHSVNQGKNLKTYSTEEDTDPKWNTSYTKERHYESTLVESKNTTYCLFTFEEKSLQETKRRLDELKLQPIYLLNVNLLSENISFSMRQREEMLHWQFVLWKEKSLISLPVDFDIITFNLISTEAEGLLSLKILYKNSNCTENFSKAFQSLHSLLSNELFANDTRYYLCHRELEDDYGRTLLYAITNIWIGYNFDCSTASSGTNESQNNLNFYFIIVIEIFCYVLSLQFVWIFVLLDISFKTKHGVGDRYKPVYTRNERPYSLKQLLFKLLFKNQYTSNDCRLLSFCYQQKPSKRLISLLLLCNAFFAIYRTLSRYFWGIFVSGDYLNVYRPNEWFFYVFYLYTNCSPGLIVMFDWFYAVLFPLGFIWLGSKLYEGYLSNDKYLCPLYLGSNKNDKNVLNENKSLSDSFIFPWYVLRAKRNNFFRKIQLILSCCFPICPFSCNALDAFACNCLNFNVLKNKYCKCVCRLLAFLLFYILFLRPIISTFTFLFRSFTYIVLVAIPINTDIMRYVVLIVTSLLYYYKFINEISNMYAEILEFIFQIKEENEQARELTDVSEVMFDAISKSLFSTRKKLYFVFLKMGVISIYLWIVLQILDNDQLALTGYDIKDIVQIALAAIGPYAISLFLKGNNKSFLTDEDKNEIKKAYNQYIGQN